MHAFAIASQEDEAEEKVEQQGVEHEEEAAKRKTGA
jgi:hypothetical protein